MYFPLCLGCGLFVVIFIPSCSIIMNLTSFGFGTFSLGFVLFLRSIFSCNYVTVGLRYIKFLQFHGFTCGIDDLLLSQESNNERTDFLSKSEEHSEEAHRKFLCKGDGDTGLFNIIWTANTLCASHKSITILQMIMRTASLSLRCSKGVSDPQSHCLMRKIVFCFVF